MIKYLLITTLMMTCGARAGTFTDPRDKQTYETIEVGGRTWMARNLNYEASGTRLFGKRTENAKYGCMYKAENAHKYVPKGWHIATDAEWQALIDQVGEPETAAKFLKSQTGWNDGGNGLDSIGFHAQAGGVSYIGTARPTGERCSWWATEKPQAPATIRYSMGCEDDAIARYEQRAVWFAYVRCVKDCPLEKPKFEATVESLKQYRCPEWFRDAKFGIYLHWGVYSVPQMDAWYARYMYWQGTDAYNHHVKTYGHPSEFGYKDLIPLWKAENFDPDALVGLFKEAGAKYFTPCAVHHDNFDLWDSKYNKWNAAQMGPKKDLIGMWKKAADKAGLRWGVTTHLQRSYNWFATAHGSDATGPLKGVPYDAAQGEGVGLYPPQNHQGSQFVPAQEISKAWRENWRKRLTQLIDDYDPDHMYFDGAIPFTGLDEGKTGMELMAHYYNTRPEGFLCYKNRKSGLFIKGLGSEDHERGKAEEISEEPWQTDDSIGPWGYVKGASYMTPDMVVDKIIDIVSKNGNMLLNVPIRADGTLDEETVSILKHVGQWFKTNGEAIYGTRPWHRFGEGDHVVGTSTKISATTSADIRFTTKGDVLYAHVLDWPENGEPVVIKSLGAQNPNGAVKQVELLGCTDKLAWRQQADQLRVPFPATQSGDYAHVLKIQFK